jgi:hypothetical protein
MVKNYVDLQLLSIDTVAFQVFLVLTKLLDFDFVVMVD